MRRRVREGSFRQHRPGITPHPEVRVSSRASPPAAQKCATCLREPVKPTARIYDNPLGRSPPGGARKRPNPLRRPTPTRLATARARGPHPGCAGELHHHRVPARWPTPYPIRHGGERHGHLLAENGNAHRNNSRGSVRGKADGRLTRSILASTPDPSRITERTAGLETCGSLAYPPRFGRAVSAWPRAISSSPRASSSAAMRSRKSARSAAVRRR